MRRLNETKSGEKVVADTRQQEKRKSNNQVNKSI